MLTFDLEKILTDYANTIKKAMPTSVANLIAVELDNNKVGGGVTAPFWLPVLEKGRGPRKSTENSQLWKRIYAWMDKRNMFESKTAKGKINEAKSMTWYINKYGTKMYRDKRFKDVYTKETEATIKKINDSFSATVYKITSDFL